MISIVSIKLIIFHLLDGVVVWNSGSDNDNDDGGDNNNGSDDD